MFVNGTKTIKIKANYSAISPYPLCLGNISKDWPVDNMKKTGLKSYVLILVLLMMLLEFLIY